MDEITQPEPGPGRQLDLFVNAFAEEEQEFRRKESEVEQISIETIKRLQQNVTNYQD